MKGCGTTEFDMPEAKLAALVEAGRTAPWLAHLQSRKLARPLPKALQAFTFRTAMQRTPTMGAGSSFSISARCETRRFFCSDSQ